MIYISKLMFWGILLPLLLSLLVYSVCANNPSDGMPSDSDDVDTSTQSPKNNFEPGLSPGLSIETQLETPPIERMNHETQDSGQPEQMVPDTSQAEKSLEEQEPAPLPPVKQEESQAKVNSDDNGRVEMPNVDSPSKLDQAVADVAQETKLDDPVALDNRHPAFREDHGAQAPSVRPQQPSTHQQQQHQHQQQQQAGGGDARQSDPSRAQSSSDTPGDVHQDLHSPNGQQSSTTTTQVDGEGRGARQTLDEDGLAIDSSQPSHPFQTHQSDSALEKQSEDARILASSLPMGTGGMAVNPRPAEQEVGGIGGAGSADVGGSSSAVGGGSVAGDGGPTEAGSEAELPTFDKWSVQYLAEQEKQKFEQEMEQAFKPGVQLGQKKLRLNFASASCGAKVVSSNPEADNIHFLLNGNPDEYMISPCKAKKWIVVELCEPLQIHKVEIGTMELFSSLPKTVRVLSSQRYPTKEWVPLGTFEMKSERTVQSFPTRVLEEYVKFVRVELVEHHGDEHYCPITFFRVLGLDMASEEEEETDNDSLDQVEGEQGDRSVSLFEKTKDTVVKLVQKVLYNTDGDQTDKKEPSTEKPADNATAQSSDANGEEVQPPSASSACSSDSPSPLNAGDPSGPFIPMPEVGRGRAPPANPMAPKVEEIQVVTKLNETEQLPPEDKEPPMVVKLDHMPEDSDCGGGTGGRSEVCVTPWLTYAKLVCSGFMLHRSLASSCKKPSLKVSLGHRLEFSTPSSSTSALSNPMTTTPTSDDAETPTSDPGVSHAGTDVNTILTDSKIISGTDAPQTNTQEAATAIPEIMSEQEEGTLSSTASTTNKAVPKESGEQESSVASSQSTVFTSAGVSTPTTQTLEPSSLTRETDGKVNPASVVTPGLHVAKSRGVNEQGSSDLTESMFLKVSPSPTTSVHDMPENTVAPETATTKLPENIAPPKDIGSGKDGDKHDLPLSSGQNGESPPVADHQKLENATAKPMADRTIDLVKVPIMLNSKRDASIIKLNNRIVALELNVSMTKKYLEELSRAFKQQNEDMMSLVNKTVNRLNANIAASEERDLQQQTQIDMLGQRLVNLTAVVSQMQVMMDQMGQELHQRQLILIMLQGVVFIWIIVSSVRSRCKPQLPIADHQFLLDTMPKMPQVLETTADGSLAQRRNSDIGVKSEGLTDMPLKRQSSDTDIARSSTVPSDPDTTVAVLMGSTQTSKRKKRKKMKFAVSLAPPSSPTEATSGSSIEPVPWNAASSFFANVTTSSHPFLATSGISTVTSAVNPTVFHHQNVKTLALSPTQSAPTVFRPGQGLLSTLPSTQAVKENILPPGSFPRSMAAYPHPGLPRSPPFSAEESDGGFFPSVPCCSPSRQLPSPSQTCSKSLSPPLGSLENVQLSQYPLSNAIGHPSSPSPKRINSDGGKESQSSSPEFKLPTYHRSKLRKLGQALGNSSSDVVNLKKGGVAKLHSGALTFLNRKPPQASVRQLQFQDFFNEEALLSENRFCLPDSKTRDSALATTMTTTTTASFIDRRSSVPIELPGSSRHHQHKGSSTIPRSRDSTNRQLLVYQPTSLQSLVSASRPTPSPHIRNPHVFHSSIAPPPPPPFVPFAHTQLSSSSSFRPPLASSAIATTTHVNIRVPPLLHDCPTCFSAVPNPIPLPLPGDASSSSSSSVASLSRKDPKERLQDAPSVKCPLTLLPQPSKPRDQGGQSKAGWKGAYKKQSPKSHRRQSSFPLEMDVRMAAAATGGEEPKKPQNSVDGSARLPSKPPAPHGKMRKSGSLGAMSWSKGQVVKASGELGLERRKGAKC